MLPAPKKQNKFALTFGLCALAAFFLFLPFELVDKGFFLYAGDFNSQQIAFSYHINNFLEQGGGSFSWATDLGSGFVNSYSFYLLGSPFFWLASVLPAAAQPYLMAPLLCLKFGTAGAGGYLWLRRYVKDENFAVLGGALYALSGFTVYNVFFNHFVDVVALFPYELWALDETVYARRRGLFPFFAAVNLLCNYFFFAGQIVFLFIYFICKCLAKEWRLSARLFAALAFESLLGCGLGCVLAWPGLLSLLQNPRTVDLASGFGFLLYYNVQQYFAIFASLFFPPDPPYLPAIFTEGVIKWTSLSAYLPAVGFAGVLAYLRAGRGSALRRALLTCAVFALVPVLNSSFYALNSSYYARWYYMPVLLMCAATVKTLESPRIAAGLPSALKTVAVCTLAFAAFALIPKKEDEAWSIGVVNNQAQFWLGLALALLGLGLFWLVWNGWSGTPRVFRQGSSPASPGAPPNFVGSLPGFAAGPPLLRQGSSPRFAAGPPLLRQGSSPRFAAGPPLLRQGSSPRFAAGPPLLRQGSSPRFAAGPPRLPRALLALVLAFGCFCGMIEIAIGKFGQWDNDARFVQQCYREARNFALPDDGGQYYRTDSFGCYDNLALWLDHPSLQFFNSTVAPSILEFYPSVGVTRDVNSKPDLEQYALRALLGVRYLLCNEQDAAEFREKADEGWQAVDQQGELILFENENWLPLGLSYEYYLTEERYETVSKTSRAGVLCKAVVLTDEQLEALALLSDDLLKPLEDRAFDRRGYEAFRQDAAERRAGAVSSFSADSRGFTATITLKEPRLVQFAVPWDEGFSASINGGDAVIYKVSHGLMAVAAPAGESEIRFTYHTPGLAAALAAAGGCAAVYAAYLGLLWHGARQKKRRKVYRKGEMQRQQ